MAVNNAFTARSGGGFGEHGLGGDDGGEIGSVHGVSLEVRMRIGERRGPFQRAGLPVAAQAGRAHGGVRRE